jgi:hypothetical protein
MQRLSSETIPSSCYRTGQAPTTIADKATNLVDQQQWVVWEGVGDAAYLEPGSLNYGMGQARRVELAADAIQGAKADGKYTFTSERTQTASATEVYTTSATYTLDKLGSTIEGTLALHSHCTGADCNSSPTCDITLTFSGIKIDADQFSVYTANPGT